MISYIPYIIDKSLLEMRISWDDMKDSCALSLEETLRLIFKKDWDSSYRFLTLNHDNRFCLVETSEEILSLFGFVLVIDGMIHRAESDHKEIYMMVRNEEFKIGWSDQGICIVPTALNLIEQIQSSQTGKVQFEVKQFENINILASTEKQE